MVWSCKVFIVSHYYSVAVLDTPPQSLLKYLTADDCGYMSIQVRRREGGGGGGGEGEERRGRGEKGDVGRTGREREEGAVRRK